MVKVKSRILRIGVATRQQSGQTRAEEARGDDGPDRAASHCRQRQCVHLIQTGASRGDDEIAWQA
jgi:hypothetical protein